MSQAGETFFTSVGCMDGRIQGVVAEFGRKKFNVLFADTITEAGLVGLLSKENIDQNLLDSIKQKIQISLEKHHSKGIIVHGHQECAGNPVDDQRHKENVLKSAKIISSIFGENTTVIPVFVKRSPSTSSGFEKGEEWLVEEI